MKQLFRSNKDPFRPPKQQVIATHQIIQNTPNNPVRRQISASEIEADRLYAVRLAAAHAQLAAVVADLGESYPTPTEVRSGSGAMHGYPKPGERFVPPAPKRF